MPIAAAHKAKLYRIDPNHPDREPGVDSPQAVLVQFNPTSLSYSVQNTLEKKGRDAKAQQHVSQSTAKLEFDLTFDNTHDGVDVRMATDRLKQFLNPGDPDTHPDQAPPLVGMRWGTFHFRGIVESFRETLDFFSVEGVPLRSSLKIGMAAQEPKDVFAVVNPKEQANLASATTRLAAVPLRGLSGLAEGGGNPSATRLIGAANGVENLRSAGGLVALTVELAATGTGRPSPARTTPRFDAARAQGAAPANGGMATHGAIGLGGRQSGSGGQGLRADLGGSPRLRFD